MADPTDYLARLAALAIARNDAADALALALRQRDQLIVAAVDAGISQTAIAAAAGIGTSRITTILGSTGPDSVTV